MNVKLQGVMISTGLKYTVSYLHNDNKFEFIGVFNDWDAIKDTFEFLESDDPNCAALIIIAGDQVLSISQVHQQEEPREVVPPTAMPVDGCKFTEADPSGLDAHEAGAKLDAGKIYADAILSEMARAIWGVAEVGTFGANKYSLGGWTSVEDGIRRYRDAAARHRLKRQMGELIDPDSGLKHTYHEAWNVLAALELEERDG